MALFPLYATEQQRDLYQKYVLSYYLVFSKFCVYFSQYDTTSPWPLTKMVASELIVYQAQWSPHSPNTYVCVSSDGIMQLWDLNVNNLKPQIYLNASDTELICCDWAKYSPNLVATGGADVRG